MTINFLFPKTYSFLFYFHGCFVCMYIMYICVDTACGGRKMILNPLELELKIVIYHEDWEAELGVGIEQVFLTAEPALQPHYEH